MDHYVMRPMEILLVEDSPSDALIAREALAYAEVTNHLHVVEDGVKAVAFLRQEGLYVGAPRPDLIMLDLNLPRKDGREVLTEVKTDASLKVIPIVILTTSTAKDDILRAYQLHANCYVTKPMDFLNFVEVVKAIVHFWFHLVTLPPGE